MRWWLILVSLNKMKQKHKPTKLVPTVKPSRQSDKLVLSFRFFQESDTLKRFQPKQLSYLLYAFKHLSQKTWLEATQQRRQTDFGYEQLSIDVLKHPYPPYLPQDMALACFRVAHQKARLIGFKEENTSVLHVLWLDFDFEVYPH